MCPAFRLAAGADSGYHEIAEEDLVEECQPVARAACDKAQWAADLVGAEEWASSSASAPDLPLTTKIDDLAASRPRRGKADRRGVPGASPATGPSSSAAPGPGQGASGGSSKRPGAPIRGTVTRFDPDSTEAMLSRPFAALSLEDLTVYKASLSGGAAAAAAQLSQLTGGGGGGPKVSKGREREWRIDHLRAHDELRIQYLEDRLRDLRWRESRPVRDRDSRAAPPARAALFTSSFGR